MKNQKLKLTTLLKFLIKLKKFYFELYKDFLNGKPIKKNNYSEIIKKISR